MGARATSVTPHDWRLAPVFGQQASNIAVVVRPSAYAVIPGNDGRIAVVGTPKGVFLPGGGIGPREDVARAIEREAFEECGLVVCVGAWRARAVEHVYASDEKTQYEKRSTFCAATLLAPSAMPIEKDHVLAWFTPDEAMGLLTPHSHRWALNEWNTLVRETPERRGRELSDIPIHAAHPSPQVFG